MATLSHYEPCRSVCVDESRWVRRCVPAFLTLIPDHLQANDLLFVTPSLLNLQEGPWIIDSLAAAQSILNQTVSFLEPKGYLRLCPSRIFQRILFAATFLFKVRSLGPLASAPS